MAADSLLIVMYWWRHYVSWVQACLFQLVCQLLPCFNGELNLVC